MNKQYKFKRYWNRIKKLSILPKHDIIEFKNVSGKHVPLKPFPVRFIATAEFIHNDTVEFTKLTFTNLVRVLIQNFITMNYHRFMLLFHWIGFLETPENRCLDWSWFEWRFWEARKNRKLKRVIEANMKESMDKEFIKKVKKSLLKNEINGREN